MVRICSNLYSVFLLVFIRYVLIYLVARTGNEPIIDEDLNCASPNSSDEESDIAYDHPELPQRTPPTLILDDLGDDEGAEPPPSAHCQEPPPAPQSNPFARARPTPTPSLPTLPPAIQPYAVAHTHWVVRAMCLVILFLHYHLHLSVRASELLLRVLNLVLGSVFGILDTNDRGLFPVSLATIRRNFGLLDRFALYIVCPRCWLLTKPQTPIRSYQCICGEDLYVDKRGNVVAQAMQLVFGRQIQAEPHLLMPVALPSTLLQSFLSVEDVEQSIDKWRAKVGTPGVLQDVSDGKVWKELRDHEGQLFFRASVPPSEARLAWSISLDW